VFDLLNIGLYHGWIMDPTDLVADVIRNQSYNQLVEMIIDNKTSGSERKATEGEYFK